MPPIKVAAPLPPTKQARESVSAARTNAAGATTINSLKAEVERLANILDVVLDELERRS